MDSGTVVILGTGGTIAGTAGSAHDHIGYSAAQVGVQALVQGVASLADAGVPLVGEQVAQIDSKDMDFAVWQALALRCQQLLDDAQVRAIVITHGTDTLEETAWLLHCVLDAARKPVVLTCAMRPATALTPSATKVVAIHCMGEGVGRLSMAMRSLSGWRACQWQPSGRGKGSNWVLSIASP